MGELTVTGGLSGDGSRFSETLVIWDGDPESKAVAAVELYGEKLSVGYGSLGGWDQFGLETRDSDDARRLAPRERHVSDC